MVNESGSWQDASQLAARVSPTLAMLRAVAAEGHLTRAAERLAMPQPTISRALAKLSEQIDAPVITHQGRGIRLTRAGGMLASAADEALRTLETGCRSVVEELDPERGQVVFGFQHTMGRGVVPTLIRDFRVQHPEVRFGLVQGARDDLLDRMASGEIDLCLISPPPSADRFLDAFAVREEPLLAVLFEQHRLAHRKALKLGELAEDDFVATRRGYGLRQIFSDLASQAGFNPRLAFESEEVDTVRGLVAAGLGVALLPPTDNGPAPGTVEIPLEPAAHRTISLAWTTQRTMPPAVRVFRDFVSASETASANE